MPVIVDSSFYQQPEEPGFLESLAAGFGQGFSKGVESAMEEKSEADRFARAQQAELEKMREAAKIRAEEAKAERGWLGTWKEREFRLQESAGALARDKFNADLDQWKQGADLRQTQLDALRKRLDSDMAMSDLDRKRVEMELKAGENAIANEAAGRMMAVRNNFAVGLGNGDVAVGNKKLDAAEKAVKGALASGNYAEANRVLRMTQLWAGRAKVEYDNKVAQDTVSAVQKDGNIALYDDLLNELGVLINDSSMSLAQRASMATALSDRARSRTAGRGLKTSYANQIAKEIATLERKMEEAEEAEDEQLQARIAELSVLGASVNAVDSEDLRGLFSVIQDGRSVFYRQGSESVSNVRNLFGGPSAAAGGMTNYLPSDAVKSLSEQNELLGKMVESNQADIDELSGLLEDMDQDSPDFLAMQAELQDLKAYQNEVKAQRRGIFRSMYPPPTPSGKGKSGSGKVEPSTSRIENAIYGNGGEEPPPSYGEGMTPEQMYDRIKELDKTEKEEGGLSVPESEERDALSKAYEGVNQGRAGASMEAAGVKQAASNLRELFPNDKYNIAKVYSRKDAEFMLGHYKQLLKENPVSQGSATQGPSNRQVYEKRDAIEAVIKELQNMIDTGSYASKPKKK